MADKPLVWLRGVLKSPPLSAEARIRAGFLLRELQTGVKIGMPDARPMPSIGRACYELRVFDCEAGKAWRIIYRIDSDAIVVVEVFAKRTQKTPLQVVRNCRIRLQDYDRIAAGEL